LMAVGFSIQAQAEAPLSVAVDHSQMTLLTSDPGTVILGNPSIADVSLNGRQLFIHGRSSGETNLMVFDQGGNKIIDYAVSVTQDGANSVILFAGTGAGTSRLSYVCAPNCDRAMIVGDNSTAFSDLVTNNQMKNGFAQGVKSSAPSSGSSAPSHTQ